MKEKLAQLQPNPVTPGRSPAKHRPTNAAVTTPPNNGHSKRAALGEIDHNEAGAVNPDENLPAPTPGQPRKSHRKDSRHHPYSRTASGGLVVDKEAKRASDKNSRHSSDSSESEEEAQLRMLAKRSSKSPVASPGQRSISYSATVTASYTLNDDIHEDRENWGGATQTVPKTPVSSKSTGAPISVSKVRSSSRRVTESRSDSKGIRKQSGRIGSSGSPVRVKA